MNTSKDKKPSYKPAIITAVIIAVLFAGLNIMAYISGKMSSSNYIGFSFTMVITIFIGIPLLILVPTIIALIIRRRVKRKNK